MAYLDNHIAVARFRQIKLAKRKRSRPGQNDGSGLQGILRFAIHPDLGTGLGAITAIALFQL
jgi:hypothetical protein